jgi:hypothetical protein
MMLGSLTRKYLNGSDLQGRPHLVKITGIGQVHVRPYPTAQPVKKLCLTIEGDTISDELPDQLLLGKQGEAALVEIFGQVDTNQVIGKNLVIFPQEIKVAGSPKTAIRIRAPKPQAQKTAPSPVQAPAPVQEDHLPF